MQSQAVMIHRAPQSMIHQSMTLENILLHLISWVETLNLLNNNIHKEILSTTSGVVLADRYHI